VELTPAQYDEIVRSNDKCLHGIKETQTQLGLIVRILNGDPEQDIHGVRPRLREVEAIVQKLEDRLQRWEDRATTAKWLIGFLGLGNLAGVIALWRLIVGGGP
jgi:hypothetical protein